MRSLKKKIFFNKIRLRFYCYYTPWFLSSNRIYYFLIEPELNRTFIFFCSKLIRNWLFKHFIKILKSKKNLNFRVLIIQKIVLKIIFKYHKIMLQSLSVPHLISLQNNNKVTGLRQSNKDYQTKFIHRYYISGNGNNVRYIKKIRKKKKIKIYCYVPSSVAFKIN